jgi:predicted RNase H-like HicB family nuclease
VRRYSIIITSDIDEGGFVVTVPALPGRVTQADTIEDAITRAHEAIAGHIEALELTGQPVPEERVAPQIASVLVA